RLGEGADASPRRPRLVSNRTDRAGRRATEILTPERWQRIEPTIDAALDLPPEERDDYVHSACAGDAALLAEVRRLLAAHDTPDAELDQPAVKRYASLLDDSPAHLPEVLGG